MTSEVTQGSVLGPALFFLYRINCLNRLSCDAVMLAGDVKIWRATASPSDVQSLQKDVECLSNWFRLALKSFNTDKCVVLSLYQILGFDVTKSRAVFWFFDYCIIPFFAHQVLASVLSSR